MKINFQLATFCKKPQAIHTMKLKYSILYLLCLLPALAGAQASLRGQLLAEGQALPFANIYLKGTQKCTVSNEKGEFLLDAITPGTYQVHIEAVGYRAWQQSLTFATDEQKDLGILQLKEDVLGLEQVVVSATREHLDRTEAPVIVGVIDQRLLRSVQAINLSEGLNFQPGLRLENNCQNCGFTQVRMNGLGGAYSQILIDGRPTFSALNGVYGLEQIPVNMLERIEVIRGGGSALYGGNAIAGTINIITKEPTDNSFEVATNSALIGGSALDNTATFNANLVNEGHNKGLSLFGLARDRDWYDANGDGFSEIVKLRNYSLGGRGFWNINEQHRLHAELHGIYELRRGGNLFDRLPEETDVTEQLKHYIVGGQLSHEYFSKNKNHKLTSYISTQHTRRGSYYGGGGNSEDPEAREAAKNFYGDTEDIALVGGVQYSRFFGNVLGREATFTAGIEPNYNKVNDRMPGYGRSIDQEVLNLGQYVQWEFRPLAKLKMLAGLRYDYAILEGSYIFGAGLSQQNDLQVGVLSPRLNFLYDISSYWQLRAGYARGFRNPQAFDEDLHIQTLEGTALFTRLSPDLRQETSNSFTASLNITKPIGMADFSLLVEGFYTYLQNPFVNEFTGESLPDGSALLINKRNGTGAYVRGVNVEAQLAPSKQWFFQLGGTWQGAFYAEAEEVLEAANGTPISTNQILRTPDLYAYFTANWQVRKPLALSVSAIYTGSMLVAYQGGNAGPNGDGSPALSNTPHFLDAMLKVAYTFNLDKKWSLELNGGVQNLFNSFQRDFDTGAERDAGYVFGPQRPRTFFVGLRLRR